MGAEGVVVRVDLLDEIIVGGDDEAAVEVDPSQQHVGEGAR